MRWYENPDKFDKLIDTFVKGLEHRGLSVSNYPTVEVKEKSYTGYAAIGRRLGIASDTARKLINSNLLYVYPVIGTYKRVMPRTNETLIRMSMVAWCEVWKIYRASAPQAK